MNLYAIHDGGDYADESFWMAVWANTPEEAEAYYRRHHQDATSEDDADGNEQEPRWGGAVVFQPTENSWETPGQDGVHEERRPEVLRWIGWRAEGESVCESCGLYAMDMRAHRVCRNCYLCPDCRKADASDPCDVCNLGG